MLVYRGQRRKPLTKPPYGTRLGDSQIARALGGFWCLNECGGSNAYDAVGANHGSFVNAPTWGFSAGIPVLNFLHASNQGVLLRNGAILGGLNRWSVIVLCSSSVVGFNAIYCERAASGNDILKFQYDGTTFAITYRNDGGTLTTLAGSTAINDSLIHLGVATKAGTALKIYTDGKPDGSATFGSGSDAFTDAGIKSQIGLDAGDATTSLSASVVYVGVCPNVTLTDGAIANLYENRFSMFNNSRRIINGAGAVSSKLLLWRRRKAAAA